MEADKQIMNNLLLSAHTVEGISKTITRYFITSGRSKTITRYFIILQAAEEYKYLNDIER